MKSMYLLTGWRHDDFAIEIDLYGSALDMAIKIVNEAGPVKEEPISYIPISAEQAMKLGEIHGWETSPNEPYYKDGKFVPEKVRCWEITVKRLYMMTKTAA